MEVGPKISIITIVYNGGEFIEKTIQSVINQEYQNKEYLIIDGASKDNTLEVIEKYKDKIDVLISEPDSGLYDAMNKGIIKSTGDFIIFMNAGDTFYSNNVISKIDSFDKGKSDIYYGETMFLKEDFSELGLRSVFTPHKLPINLTWKNMKHGMVVCHQSFFVSKKIAVLYDLSYKYSSDVDWVIKCLKQSKKVTNLNFIVSNYLKGGLSDQKTKETLIERYNVLQKHFGFASNIFNHFWIVSRSILRKIKVKIF